VVGRRAPGGPSTAVSGTVTSTVVTGASVTTGVSGAAGVVIDISGLEEVDTYVARVLADTARMAKLMGTRSVLVGMRPEVAATLVRMGYAMSGVETALDVDQGLSLLAGEALS